MRGLLRIMPGGDFQADHGVGVVAKRHWIGNSHDPQDLGLDQLADPIAHRAFGDAKLLGDCGEGGASVVLENPDDGEVDRVECGWPSLRWIAGGCVDCPDGAIAARLTTVIGLFATAILPLAHCAYRRLTASFLRIFQFGKEVLPQKRII